MKNILMDILKFMTFMVVGFFAFVASGFVLLMTTISIMQLVENRLDLIIPYYMGLSILIVSTLCTIGIFAFLESVMEKKR